MSEVSGTVVNLHARCRPEGREKDKNESEGRGLGFSLFWDSWRSV